MSLPMVSAINLLSVFLLEMKPTIYFIYTILYFDIIKYSLKSIKSYTNNFITDSMS